MNNQKGQKPSNEKMMKFLRTTINNPNLLKENDEEIYKKAKDILFNDGKNKASDNN